MVDDDPFTPNETLPGGEIVSARDLGWFGADSLEPTWEALYEAETAAGFYRAAAILIFHARHLHPISHAELARLLQKPFKRAAHAPSKWKRHEEIVEAIGKGPEAPKRTGGFAFFHEWEGLPRKEVIWQIQQRYGLQHEAAAKAYSAARKTVRERAEAAASGDTAGGQ